MAKYKVEYADTFDKAMKKLDRRDQRFIIHWIDQHLNNVDFPTSPGKSLKGNFSGYVRFRVGNYRIIAEVDNDKFVITNMTVGHRSEVYKIRKFQIERSTKKEKTSRQTDLFVTFFISIVECIIA